MNDARARIRAAAQAVDIHEKVETLWGPAPRFDLRGTMPEPEYPEHEKLKAISDKSQACGEFLEWLKERGIALTKRHTHGDGCFEQHVHDLDCPRWCKKELDNVCGANEGDYIPISESTVTLLAEHFGINQSHLESEKRAMLDALRASTPNQNPA